MEKVALNSTSAINNGHTGRAQIPKLLKKSLHCKSSHLPIEHSIWHLGSSFLVGNDLYSTLWATLSSVLVSAAHATRLDSQSFSYFNTSRWIDLQFPLFYYLLNVDGSPFYGSLHKLKLQPQRWTAILTWPLGQYADTLNDLAKEARSYANSLNAMATIEARQEFGERIAESLDDGDAFLHKYVKAAPVSPPVTPAGWSLGH